jgi:hypothetical protein
MTLLSRVHAPATAETRQATPRVFDDGSAEAPRGSPQLPMLLSGYAARPPWAVAGVDYFVAHSAHTILKDLSTIGSAGVSVDVAQGVVYVTGRNVMVDGYDFATAGGYGIVIQSGISQTVIQNCNVQGRSNQLVPIHAVTQVGNLTVQYNTIDRGGAVRTGRFGRWSTTMGRERSSRDTIAFLTPRTMPSALVRGLWQRTSNTTLLSIWERTRDHSRMLCNTSGSTRLT